MNDRKKEQQSIIVRGIAAAIQAMHMPTFANLKDMVSKFGWTLTRNKQTNEQDESNSHG